MIKDLIEDFKDGIITFSECLLMFIGELFFYGSIIFTSIFLAYFLVAMIVPSELKDVMMRPIYEILGW